MLKGDNLGNLVGGLYSQSDQLIN